MIQPIILGIMQLFNGDKEFFQGKKCALWKNQLYVQFLYSKHIFSLSISYINHHRLSEWIKKFAAKNDGEIIYFFHISHEFFTEFIFIFREVVEHFFVYKVIWGEIKKYFLYITVTNIKGDFFCNLKFQKKNIVYRRTENKNCY